MKFLFLLTILTLLLIPFFPVQAIELVPDCAKGGNGGICCMLKIVSNFAQIILGLVGAVALLFFIIGGFMWITSAGSAERVKKGQSLMVNTIIGILIVVAAWIIVNFIIASFITTDESKTDIIIKGMDKEWYNICEGEPLEN